MNFDFLNNVTIAQPVIEHKVTTTRKAVEKSPTNGADLRLFKDGSIYPSQELVNAYELEYNANKSGNGFDVFTSLDWNQYPSNAEAVVFIASIPKSETRVSLFSSAREVNGELTSVLAQGSKTFGTELITMLQQTYENSLFTDNKYIDLVIVEDVELNLDIVYVPKPINKGVNKGMMSTERRENVVLHPLALFTVEATTEPEMAVVEEELV